MAELANGPSLERDFSKVILTLDNVFVPVEKLSPTPSSLDGLDSAIEVDLRILGCELIQTSGILMKLPQVSLRSSWPLAIPNPDTGLHFFIRSSVGLLS